MFHDRVFLNNITPENIFSLTVPNGLNQLTLPMKPEKREQYVLRDCKRTANGYQTTEHRLSDHILRYDIKKCGEIAGFKLPVIPRNLRYGSGTAFNQDSTLYQSIILLLIAED